ncbi:MAG: hypothetical protein L3K03_08645 [Thermoplasmata archaeon]|nr:hypothetical protein [Thermoplasmata archaeon]
MTTVKSGATDAEEGPVVRAIVETVAEATRRRSARGIAALPRFTLSELRDRLRRERVFADPSRTLLRLRRRGFLQERGEARGDRSFLVVAPEELLQMLREELARHEETEPLGFAGAPDEGEEIHDMDAEFVSHLREVLSERLDETVEFGRTLSVDSLATYLKDLFGEALYLDSLIALLQQYALADVPLVAPTGRTTGSTGFHLALFGPPGTGKTFAIDDLIRGDPRHGVPAHGLPGRNRYCGGITPVQFLRVGAFYTGRTFNFIVPEFNDWFKYKGMVEPLKLVMEQREVKWETTLGTVGPYTFRSFFTVNYNVRAGGDEAWSTTMTDPNFAALEDRMLLRFHAMTRERFRAVEASAERLELGKIDFPWAGPLRDHLTLVHAIETRHPLVAGKFRSKSVALDPALYERLRGVSEKALQRNAEPAFSPRLKIRAVRLAAASALLGYFAHEKSVHLPIGSGDAALAASFYAEEIRAREGRRSASRRG